MTPWTDYLKQEVFDTVSLNNSFEEWEEDSIRRLSTALDMTYQDWGEEKRINKSDIVDVALNTPIAIDMDGDWNATETLPLNWILVDINTYLQQEGNTWKVEVKPEYFETDWSVKPEVPSYIQSIADNERWVSDIALLIQAFGVTMLDNDVERGYGSYLDADLDAEIKTEVAMDSIFGAQTLHVAQKALSAVVNIKQDDSDAVTTINWVAALDKEGVSFESYTTAIQSQLASLKQETLQPGNTEEIETEDIPIVTISHIRDLPQSQDYPQSCVYRLTLDWVDCFFTSGSSSIKKSDSGDYIDFPTWQRGDNNTLLITYNDWRQEQLFESAWQLTITPIESRGEAETEHYCTETELKELLPDLKLACGEGIQKVEILWSDLYVTLSPYEWNNPRHSTTYRYHYKVKNTSIGPVVEYNDPSQQSLVSYYPYTKRLKLAMKDTYSRQASVERFLTIRQEQNKEWLSISTFIPDDDPQFSLISYRSGRHYAREDSPHYGKRFWITSVETDKDRINFQFDYHGSNTLWHYQNFSLDYRDFGNLWIWSDWFWDVFKIKMAEQIRLAAVSEAAASVLTQYSDQNTRRKDIMQNPHKYLAFTALSRVKDYIVYWSDYASVQ